MIGRFWSASMNHILKRFLTVRPFLDNDSNYPGATADISYFPGTKSLQKSPYDAVVILWLIPFTIITASGIPFCVLISRTNPFTPLCT